MTSYPVEKYWVQTCDGCGHRLMIDQPKAIAAVKKSFPNSDPTPYQSAIVMLEQNRWVRFADLGKWYCPRCYTLAEIVSPTPAPDATLPPETPTGKRGRELDLE